MTMVKALPQWLTRDFGTADLKALGLGAYKRVKQIWWSHPMVVFRWDNETFAASHSGPLNANADFLLEIPEERALSFDLPLILANERPSAALILAQISNWTPFSAAEVWLLPPNGDAETARECLYVPKKNLASPLAAAAREAIRIDGLIFESRPNTPFLFERRAGWLRRLRHRALALVLATLPFTFGLLAWACLSRIEREEALLQQHLVKLLNETRKGVATGNDRLDGAIRAVAQRYPTRDLATLLAALPADIALQDVSWQSGRLVIQLDEKDRSRLVQALGTTRWSVNPSTQVDAGRNLIELVPR